MSVRPEQIDDMVTSTLPELGRFKWTDIYPDLQRYVAFKELIKKRRVKIEGGHEVEWRVKVANGNQAEWTGLYDTDDIQVNNVLKKASLPWALGKSHFAYDKREGVFNRGSAQIINYLKLKRAEAMMSLAELLETAFWSLPDTGADNKKPYGIPYSLVKNSAEGFNGGNPAGFNDVAGLDRNIYKNWKNWAGPFAAASETDLVRKLKKACEFTYFEPPIEFPSHQNGSGMDYGHYTVYDNIYPLEEYLRSSNENLGMDVGKYKNKLMVGGAPVTRVPQLEADASKPWYGINWSFFHTMFPSGDYMKYSKPEATNSHNVKAVWVDVIMQFRNVDPRRSFVLSV